MLPMTLAHLVAHGRCYGARTEVALLDVEGDALLEHAVQLVGERLGIGDRARG